MVSKVAVIALVVIVACPILLGYAMNLQQVDITDYKTTGDSVNVTPLLQSGTDYSYVHADSYSLNSNFLFEHRGYNLTSKIAPIYESVTSTKSAFPMMQWTVYNQNDPYPGARILLSNIDYFYYQYDHPGNTGQINFQIIYYGTETAYSSVYQRIHSIYFDTDENKFYFTYYNQLNHGWLSEDSLAVDPSLNEQLTYKFSGTVTAGSGVLQRALDNESPNYVDLSAGYTIDDFYLSTNNITTAVLPEHPRNVLMTVDLNSISDSSYDFKFSISSQHNSRAVVTLEKTTDGGGNVHWNAYHYGTYVHVAELYYDSSRSSNTYQIYLDTSGGEFRYVGDWPTIIGEANYYQKYEFTWTSSLVVPDVGNLYFYTNTPKMRIDDSEYRAFEYPIIENKTYDPASFKSNPSTTIKDITMYGTSLSFGGNTYTINNGNITLGTHQIPVRGLEFKSVAVDSGYENRIGNTVISTTADPSTITFNGKWSASITTVAQDQYTISKTEWVAGSFGWDGIDHNFLIVGLITSLGAFIALGIYMRRSKASLWPLLIVCGGAAVLFFIML